MSKRWLQDSTKREAKKRAAAPPPKMRREEAAVVVAKRWLDDAGLHEGDDIGEISDVAWAPEHGDTYVTFRIRVGGLDIDREIEGT